MRSPRASLASVALSLADAALSPVAWLQRALSAPLLPHAIAAPRRIFTSSVGRISYYEDDSASGPPVVLLHDLGPAGCAYEVRALFDALRPERPVIAADLPGYGFSERRAAPLERAEYVAFIDDLVADVSRRYGAAVDLVAVGTAGELAARAVMQNPRPVRSLVIIAPTGVVQRAGAFAGAVDRGLRHVASAVRSPAIGTALHLALTSKPALRLALGAARDARIIAYANAAAHQPRARHAALAALVGGVSDRSIAVDVYTRLSVPTCFVHGDLHASRIDALTGSRAGLRSARVTGARARPHLERSRETTDALRAFWRTLSRRPELRLVQGERARMPGGDGTWRPRAAPRPRRAREGREGREGKRWT